MRLQRWTVCHLAIASAAAGAVLVSCADKSSRDRTAIQDSATPDEAGDSTDSNFSKSKSAEQITGTNLRDVRVVAESISLALKKFKIQATTDKAEKLVLTAANAGRFNISDVNWTFSGPAQCSDAATDRYSRVCQLSGDQAATLRVAVKIITKQVPEGLSSPTLESPLQPNAVDSSGKKLIFMIAPRGPQFPNGFDGNLLGAATGSPLDNIDAVCTAILGNGGGLLGQRYTWKGLVKNLNESWSQRMLTGPNPVDGLILSEELGGDSSKVQFTRDLTMISMGAGGLSLVRLMPAGTPLRQGIMTRTNEIHTSENYGPIGGSSPTPAWFGEGCSGWSANLAESGSSLDITPISAGGTAMLSPRLCNSKIAVTCLGIEL